MAQIRGKNLTKVKQQNMASIKTILYNCAPLSRVEIAEHLELTPPTVTNIVAELVGQGVVKELIADEDEKNTHGVGRKPINIDIVAGSRLALGVSLGREFTHYCITDLRGGNVAQGFIGLMPEEYDAMVKQLINLLRTLKSRYSAEWESLIGIGLAIPGIVDTHDGILKNHGSERLDWRDKPLAQIISNATGLPTRLTNNVRARACAVALFRPNLLPEDTTFAYCHVSWGIACPIVLGNNFFKDENSAAGEIGKMVIVPSNSAGEAMLHQGTLEELSSLKAIIQQCQSALSEGRCTGLLQFCSDPAMLTIEHVLAAQNKGDADVCEIMDRSMFYLGIALANVVGIMNPHLIFLSGAMFRNEHNFETVAKSLDAHVFCSDNEKPQLVDIDLGEYGGAVGAAACCIEKYFVRAE